MTEENNNLPVRSNSSLEKISPSEDELEMKKMMDQQMMLTAMESMNQYMPAAKSMLLKGVEHAKKFFDGDKKRILIQQEPESGEIFMIILDTKGIEAMKFTGGTFVVHPLQKFLDIINTTNDLGDIEKNFKDLK